MSAREKKIRSATSAAVLIVGLWLGVADVPPRTEPEAVQTIERHVVADDAPAPVERTDALDASDEGALVRTKPAGAPAHDR